jgi:hypothetical protein
MKGRTMSILWIVDRGSPAAGLAAVPSDSAQNMIFYNERTTVFSVLAAAIRQRLHQPVRLLRLLSHGDAGRLFLSNVQITESNVRLLGFLREFVTPAAIGAGIEIFGCGVASDYLPPPRRESGIGNVAISNYGNMQGNLTSFGYSAPESLGSSIIGTAAAGSMRSTRGFRFLQALADVCGVGVRGCVDYQSPDSRWRQEGPTMTVYPNRGRSSEFADPANRYGFGQFVTF